MNSEDIPAEVLARITTGSLSQLRERALAVVRNTNQAATRKFHLVEDWRDKLIANNDALTEFIEKYPQVDIQQLRTLIRNAKREQEKNQPPKAFRELFQLIKPAILEE